VENDEEIRYSFLSQFLNGFTWQQRAPLLPQQLHAAIITDGHSPPTSRNSASPSSRSEYSAGPHHRAPHPRPPTAREPRCHPRPRAAPRIPACGVHCGHPAPQPPGVVHSTAGTRLPGASCKYSRFHRAGERRPASGGVEDGDGRVRPYRFVGTQRGRKMSLSSDTV
jgi:hypothetical protein